MSNIAIKGAATGTGVFTLESPATNTNRTLTLPDATGTILTTATAGVPIGGPAFSASKDDTQGLTTATYTKITFGVEEFDTNSNFAASRFTPTVSGYYTVSAGVYGFATSTTYIQAAIYKNGANFKNTLAATQNGSNGSGVVSSVIYFNGTTDFVEVYASVNGTGPGVQGPAQNTYFSAAMVRSAT